MIVSAGLEIYAVLLILLAEIFSSSFHQRWANPKHKKPPINGKIKWTKKYFEKDDKRYPHYIGVGRVLKAILDDADELFEIPNRTREIWEMLRGIYVYAKPTIQIKSTRKGTAEDNQMQIENLKKYPQIKILGFVLLFFAFAIQFIYSIIIFTMQPYY